MGPIHVIVLLVSVVLRVCQSVASDATLETRWRALLVNCSTEPRRPRAYNQASLQDAQTLFDEIALDRTQRSTWLHDLGEWHLLGGGNVTRAEEFLRASADLGHADAQFLVGALAATSATPSPAASAVFYQFASHAGSMQATMALAYRHLVGYHAPRSRDSALRYYKVVADDVMRHKHALPNRALPIQVFSIPAPARLTDDQTKLPETDDDERARVEYLRQRAASSSAKKELMVRTASLVLFSDLYQDGTKAHVDAQRDAVNLLGRAAGLGSGYARALLGHVYAYGLAGVRVDVQRAIPHYEEAYNASNASRNDRSGETEAANGLGMLYLNGVGGQLVNVERAMSYFQVAVRKGHAEGVYHAAGVMARVDARKSVEYLEASADVGHVGAIFRLARVKEKQRFRGMVDHNSECDAVVKLYKRVAEHNQYARTMLKRAMEAFLSGQYEQSLRLYRIAAELGFEVAEQNAAWLLDRYVFSRPSDAVDDAAYMQLIQRGMAQRSVNAVVRAGDVAYNQGHYRLAMKQYLRAIDQDPSHAQALFSVGFMCEWGLGTIHNGRSLARARWYYEQAQQHEPLLAYVLPMAIVRIDMKMIVSRWITQFHELVLQVLQVIETSLGVRGEDEQKGKLVFDDETVLATDASEQPIVFVPAMAFDGVSSSLTIDTTPPSRMMGVTVETRMWIEHPATKSPRPRQVLLEWANTLCVELAPHRDGVSWQLCVRASASYESVLTMTAAALRARRWYRIVLSVDAVNAKVSLKLDGHVADSGNLLSSLSIATRHQLIHIGQAPNVATDGFHGKFVGFRLWGTALDAAGLHSEDKALWIDLQFTIDARAQGETDDDDHDGHIVNRQQEYYSSAVTARGVDLRMVRLPALHG